jgi:hypothetical protein
VFAEEVGRDVLDEFGGQIPDPGQYTQTPGSQVQDGPQGSGQVAVLGDSSAFSNCGRAELSW